MIPIKCQHLITMAIAALMVSCAAHDSKYGSVSPGKDSISSINGSYANIPIYPTKKETGYPEGNEYLTSLTWKVHTFTKDIDRVSLQVMDDGSLIVSSFEGHVKKAEKHIPTKPGGPDNPGKLVLDSRASGPGGESGLLGVETRAWELFTDSEGNLVFQESGGGAGLLLVVPYAFSVKNISIYQRISNGL